MNVQVTACQSALNVLNVFNSHCGPSMLCVAPRDVFILRTKSLKLTTDAPIYRRKILPKTYLRLKTGASSYQRWTPVCLFGGKGKPENGNEVSPWKSLEKAMGNLKKEQSIEDALRQQIEKQEYYDDGGSGGNRSGGGGGGGSGSGSGGSGDEGFLGSLDEALQVILATIGLICLYLYIVRGGDQLRLVARDYIKFLFGAEKSNRLRRAMKWWGKLYRKFTRKKLYKPHLLEREIVNTPTMWDDPIKYYGEVEDDPNLDIGDVKSSLEPGEDDNDWFDWEKDDDESFLASGEVDESSLKSGEDGKSYLDSGEVDEPYLASKEEDEPDLVSKLDDEPDLASNLISYNASKEEDEPDIISKLVDEADLASSEDGECNLISRLSSMMESDEEDDVSLDGFNYELLEAYFAPRVTVVENDVEELDVNILVDGKEYEKVEVILGDEEEDDDADDEEEDNVVEDEDENDYVGDKQEDDDDVDNMEENDEEDGIEGDSVVDYLHELLELDEDADVDDIEGDDEDEDDIYDMEGDDEYEEEDGDIDDTEGDDDIDDMEGDDTDEIDKVNDTHGVDGEVDVK